ncbi:MAG: M20/M25/M40 family metallo-hydrolase, partial [Myxococcales bacterium]
PSVAGHRFSVERAMHILQRLCDEIGERPNGTSAHADTAEMLAEELRLIPGVEVELQHASGVQRYKSPPWPFPPFVYRTTNVVARLPGRASTALLLNAHFDTVVGTAGAGDDALGVAVMVEALRVLANGPKLEHTIVVNLNGAEEMGLLGAAGFLQHRLAKDVRAYVSVDGGPSGSPFVVGAGPHNAWLLKEYAKASGATHTTVIGEDVMASGLLAHTGDFLPFQEAGLVGIDVGALSDFWSVHTDRDDSRNIDRATFQAMGDKILSVAQGLANGPLPGNVDHTRYVYYDILGWFVLIYTQKTAQLMAVVALLLSAFALTLAIRRGAFALRALATACIRLLLVDFAALCAPVLIALLLAFGVRRPHGWFAQPALALWVFGTASVAGGLSVLAWLRRRNRSEPALAAWGSGLCFWSALLGLATCAGTGAAYIALWWTLGMAVGLIGTLLWPSWKGAWWLVSFVPGSVLALSFFALVFPFLVADIGFVSAPMPLDAVVALFVALGVSALLPSAVAVLEVRLRLGRMSLACAFLALLGTVVIATVNPYSKERPKRVAASLVDREGECRLFIASKDALPLAPTLRNVPEVTRLVPQWSPLGRMNPPFTYSMPAAMPGSLPPQIEVLSSNYDALRNLRTVNVRLRAAGPQLRLFIPRLPLRGWSLGELATVPLDANQRVAVLFEDASAWDRDLTLELDGTEPTEVELITIRGASDAPEMAQLAKRLPPWVALQASEIRIAKQRI